MKKIVICVCVCVCVCKILIWAIRSSFMIMVKVTIIMENEIANGICDWHQKYD
jgi:hypothetical protein